MRLTLLLLSLLVAVVSGFHSQSRLVRLSSSGYSRFDTSRHGIFDKFIESMEAGYKGEESAFQKQKAFDEQKRAEQRKRAEERKARGYTELKDLQGKKTFSKLKYEEENDDAAPPAKDAKKFFGLF